MACGLRVTPPPRCANRLLLPHCPSNLPVLPRLPLLCPREEAGLDQAMSLDGTSLLGRRIRVGYAQPKKEQSAA